MTKIVAIAIAKNEAKNVKKFLKNIKSFDAAYVLDTGSTDNTVTLLEQAGVTVYSKIYEDFDFAQARNDCLDWLPDEVDWCFTLDFTDILDIPPEEIAKVRLDTEHTGMCIECYTTNESIPSGKEYIRIEDKLRMHRKEMYRWEYAIHERLVNSKKNIAGAVGSLNIKLYKKLIKTAKKTDFYLNICLRAYEKEPSVHYLWFIFNGYYDKKDWEHAKQWGQRYLRATPAYEDTFRISVFIRLSNIYKEQGLTDQAIDHAFHAFSEALKCKNSYSIFIDGAIKALEELGINIINTKRD